MSLIIFLWRVLRESFLLFFRQRYYTRCSALTYTSLLGFIPLVSVLMATFSKLPLVKDQLPKLQSFVFHHFLPEQGEKIFWYIQQFISQATQLPWSQFIFLIVISGALVLAVEHTLNTVWEVERHRRALHSLARSWSVILLTTVFVVLSLMLSRYLRSVPLWRHAHILFIFSQYLSWCLPFFSSFAGFSLLYVVAPNRKVPIKHALIGGGIVSILFEIVKRYFAWYIHSISAYNAIYGTLAVIPLFMIWVYFFWCIVVYGALVTHQLGNLSSQKRTRRN